MRTILGFLAFALMICTAAVKPAISAPQNVAADIRSRAGNTITPDDITKALANALQKAGAGNDIDVKIMGANRDAAYSYATPISMKVNDLKFDAKAGTYTATLNFESEGQPLSPSAISGRYDEMTSVPTLKRRLFQGDVIALDDIAITKVPTSRLRKGTVTDSAQLIGRSPIKVVSANRPVLVTDIQAPALINKGDQITLRYISGNLSINTLGEALDSGAMGDHIRVKNSTSGKTVQAEVKNKQLAMVQSLIQTADDSRK